MISRLVSSSLSLALTATLFASPVWAQATADATATNAPAAAPAPAPAATPAPAPAAADTTAPAAPAERPTSYTMEAGDSLDSIAHKFDTSIKELAKLNKIPKSKYRKLRAGTVLQIPPAKTEATAK